jgi:hypothetical protein
MGCYEEGEPTNRSLAWGGDEMGPAVAFPPRTARCRTDLAFGKTLHAFEAAAVCDGRNRLIGLSWALSVQCPARTWAEPA